MLSIGILFSLLSTIASLSFPILLKNIINDITKNNFTPMSIFMLILIALLDLLFTGISMYLLARVGELVVLNLREKLWKKILNAKFGFFEKNSNGEIISRLMNDTNLLNEIFSTEVAEFITGIFTVIGTIFILIKLDALLTLLIAVNIPFITIIIYPLGKFLFKNSKEVQKANANTSNYILDKLNNIRLIKTSSTLTSEIIGGNNQFKKIYNFDMKRNMVQSIITPIIMLIFVSTIIGMIFFGAYRVIKGIITPGNLFAFIVYIIQLMPSLITIVTFWNKISVASGASSRIYDILNFEDEGKNIINFHTNKNISSLILKNIVFSKNGEKIIDDFSFNFKINNFYNIVGFSGAGKSTIFNIICKFIIPTSGSLSINNDSNYSTYDWRNNIAYISQSINMFEDTLRMNILYGVKEKYTDDEILNYLSKIGLKNIVNKLPKGLDTKISRDSSILSGGEKQRIALLRGVLSKKTILLIDEVSSNVDSKNDYMIYSFLKENNSGRIILNITHKLSNFQNDDNIVVIDKGKIESYGTENQLMVTSPIYKKLKKFYNGKVNKGYLNKKGN
ncbi:ABC transporter ATP-binding protein [Lactobacillus sp. LL6]|uniref:ABC transporter ATP-binding protein n=1 Tax=Lactobacillus sp. LL6 TaxID=2596827 RepID=UPI001F5BE74F|nr:ABC transporter ATP-binding protein [Lactobacillus sp. LL6]